MKSYKQMMNGQKKTLEMMRKQKEELETQKKSIDAKRKNYAITKLQDDLIRIRRQLDLIDRFIEDFIDDNDKYLVEK